MIHDCEVTADLVFEKDLICREEDVEFQSLVVDMHPLMCPDLLKENTGENVKVVINKLQENLTGKRKSDF